MITRKLVYGGVVAVMVAGSAWGVQAQNNTPATHSKGSVANFAQLAQQFQATFGHYFPMVAQATPQPTAQPAAKPAAQATPVPQAPYIGLRLEDTAKGVTVREVLSDSPAAAAGLKVDDIIQTANGTAIKNVTEFAGLLLKLKPDDSLKLDVMRADKAQALTVKVGSEDKANAFVMPAAMPYDGLSFDAMNKAWQVFQLSDHSLLYTAGLRTNDLITGFDGVMVAPADYQVYRDTLKADANVKLTLKSAGKDKTITVPGAALKSLDIFDYNSTGILIDVLPAGNVISPNLDQLLHVTPVDAIAYNGKNWQVYSLVDGSALQVAGLQVNDQISAIDGKAYTPDEMRKWLGSVADSTELKLTVERAGKAQEIKVSANDLAELYLIGDTNSALFFGMPNNGLMPTLGVGAVDLTDAIVKERKLKQTSGALVTSFEQRSAAESAGLQKDDIITAIGDKKIDAKNDFKSVIDALKPGETVTLDVIRGDKTMQFKATVPMPDVTGELPFLMRPF